MGTPLLPRLSTLFCGTLGLALLSSPLGAQAPDSTGAEPPAAVGSRVEVDAAAAADRERPEERAERARRGAGLRLGAFQVQGVTAAEGALATTTPAFEGYFQRGLDKHLAIESSIGFWRRTESRDVQGGVLGGEGGSRARVTSYLVPLLTSIKMYPFTSPESAFEPYLVGGLGFTLGIDDHQDSSGVLGLGSGDGVSMQTGLGFKGGAGADVRLGGAFGLGVGARYQWSRFGAELGGNRTWQGWTLDAGMVYRFQY